MTDAELVRRAAEALCVEGQESLARELSELAASLETRCLVPRGWLQRLADVDWFTAPKGAAAEQAILAQQMLQHYDRAATTAVNTSEPRGTTSTYITTPFTYTEPQTKS